jgi:hypothetical protein
MVFEKAKSIKWGIVKGLCLLTPMSHGLNPMGGSVFRSFYSLQISILISLPFFKQMLKGLTCISFSSQQGNLDSSTQ